MFTCITGKREHGVSLEKALEGKYFKQSVEGQDNCIEIRFEFQAFYIAIITAQDFREIEKKKLLCPGYQ